MSEMDSDGFGGSGFSGDGGFSDAGIDAGGFSGDGGGFANAGFDDAGFGAYSEGFSYAALDEAGQLVAVYSVEGLPVAAFMAGMFGYGVAGYNAIAGRLASYPVGYALGYSTEANGQAMSLGINTNPDNYGLSLYPGGNDSP